MTTTSPRLARIADLVEATTPVGPADGEFRAVALDVGDAVRWHGQWHVVMGGQAAADGVYLRVLHHPTGTWRTVRYRRAVWVAALPAPRSEAA